MEDRINDNKRLRNEVAHGMFIVQKGEKIWNWSSPAGQIRWERRSRCFSHFLGNECKRVLEIGCGTGLFTKEICKTNNQIVAIDISEDLIKVASKRVNEGNVTFIVGNAYDTQFDDHSFDRVVGSSSLHHLDVDRALKEIYRLLKPDGELMFTEPNMLNPQIAVQKNISLVKKMAGDSPDETAFFRWSISGKLKKVGFRDIITIPFDFVHPAIPRWMLFLFVPVSNVVERIPIVKEFAGSLIIRGKK